MEKGKRRRRRRITQRAGESNARRSHYLSYGEGEREKRPTVFGPTHCRGYLSTARHKYRIIRVLVHARNYARRRTHRHRGHAINAYVCVAMNGDTGRCLSGRCAGRILPRIVPRGLRITIRCRSRIIVPKTRSHTNRKFRSTTEGVR